MRQMLADKRATASAPTARPLRRHREDPALNAAFAAFAPTRLGEPGNTRWRVPAHACGTRTARLRSGDSAGAGIAGGTPPRAVTLSAAGDTNSTCHLGRPLPCPAIRCASPSSTTGSTPGAAARTSWPSWSRCSPMPISSRWSTSCRDELRVRAFGGKRARTSFLQRLPFARTRFRNYLPLMPRAIESLDVGAYDLVISSSHAVAKGVRTRPGQLHLCYCHTPMRYAWDLREQYLDVSGIGRGLRGPLVRGAARAGCATGTGATSARVDRFIADLRLHPRAHPSLLRPRRRR